MLAIVEGPIDKVKLYIVVVQMPARSGAPHGTYRLSSEILLAQSGNDKTNKIERGLRRTQTLRVVSYTRIIVREHSYRWW